MEWVRWRLKPPPRGRENLSVLHDLFSSFVSPVRNPSQKRIEFERAFNRSLNIHLNAGVTKRAGIIAYPMPLALREGVTERATTLGLVTNAAVEIVLVSGIDPEREQPGGKKIIHQFRD